jgi:ketosteroid isomerase-like protein
MDSMFALDRMGAIADVNPDTAEIVSVGRIIQSIEGIQAYCDMLQGSGVSWDQVITDLEVRDDRAIRSGASELHYRSGGETLVSRTRYTLVWTKDPACQWWIDRAYHTPMARVIGE